MALVILPASITHQTILLEQSHLEASTHLSIKLPEKHHSKHHRSHKRVVKKQHVNIPVPVKIPSNAIVKRLRAIGGEPLVNLIQRESGFNPNAVNPSSGACGLFQRLPCSVKLGDVDGQIADGVRYIKARYGTFTAAWNFWLNNNWY